MLLALLDEIFHGLSQQGGVSAFKLVHTNKKEMLSFYLAQHNIQLHERGQGFSRKHTHLGSAVGNKWMVSSAKLLKKGNITPT